MSMPDLDRNGEKKLPPSSRALVRITAMATAPACTGPSLEGPSRLVYGVCAFAWGFGGSLSLFLSVEEGRSTFDANGRNLSQILGDYQGRVESPPIIGFF